MEYSNMFSKKYLELIKKMPNGFIDLGLRLSIRINLINSINDGIYLTDKPYKVGNTDKLKALDYLFPDFYNRKNVKMNRNSPVILN